jgi:hypothetical protein
LNATLSPRFRSGPWTGDVKPADADEVNGVEVVERIVTRSDRPGAVVRLASGQLAVLGESFAVGAPRMLKLWAPRRMARATAPADRAWWTQVRRAISG